jgi:hypothetical protein
MCRLIAYDLHDTGAHADGVAGAIAAHDCGHPYGHPGNTTSGHHGHLSATLMILKSSPAPSQTQTENVQLVRQKAAKPRHPTE